MSEENPFDLFRESSPLADIPKDSMAEFLSRINDDLVAGHVERITDERIEQLVAGYRQQALDWETKQREKPVRKTPAERKDQIKVSLGISLKV